MAGTREGTPPAVEYGYACDFVLMTFKAAQLSTRFRVPKTQRLVLRARDGAPSLCLDDDAGDSVLMPVDAAWLDLTRE
jgi:hypothetical protein